MLLTLTTTMPQATDLGFLLHKHPDKARPPVKDDREPRQSALTYRDAAAGSGGQAATGGEGVRAGRRGVVGVRAGESEVEDD